MFNSKQKKSYKPTELQKITSIRNYNLKKLYSVYNHLGSCIHPTILSIDEQKALNLSLESIRSVIANYRESHKTWKEENNFKSLKEIKEETRKKLLSL